MRACARTREEFVNHLKQKFVNQTAIKRKWNLCHVGNEKLRTTKFNQEKIKLKLIDT